MQLYASESSPDDGNKVKVTELEGFHHSDGSSEVHIFDDDLEDVKRPNEDGTENTEGVSAKKKKGSSRKSKQNALDEIRSESQRMVRQSRVSLPYHRPKQRSLADFLNRRKSISVVPLKAAPEKLNEVWQLIEQREKLAEKFFNSESDESEDETANSIIENKFTMNTTAENNEENMEKKSLMKPSQKVPFSLEVNEFSSEFLKKAIKRVDLPGAVSGRSEASPTLMKSSQKENYSLEIVCTSTENVSKGSGSDNEIISEIPSLLTNTSQEIRFSKMTSSTDIFADSDVENSDVRNVSVSNERTDTNEKVSFLKEKLNQIPELTLTPKISGSSDGIIILDENLPKVGTLDLKKRFMKHLVLKRKNEKKTEEMSILSSEVNAKGEITKLKEEIISITDEEKLPKLGKKLNVLKATLQQQMAQLREQQLAKRVQDYKLYEDEIEPEDKADVDEIEDEEIMDLTENETESESEEELIEDKKEKKVKNPFVDDEAEVSEDEDLEDDENTVESDRSDEDSLQEQKRKNKQIRVDYMPKVNQKTKQFTESQNETVDNLLELCSGHFTSQAFNLKDLETEEGSESQYGDIRDAEELYDAATKDSDSEDEFVVQKNKIRTKKLYISDDEDEEDDKEAEEDDKEAEEDINSDNVIVYDENEQEGYDEKEEDSIEGEKEDLLSEEEEEENLEEKDNMVEVEDEEDELARKISKEFLDGEAELSGSDWESADEDERYLDELEDEVGDEDKISQRKLQRELGKIHFKEIMAEDNREVRLLQELLLEDGELHSDGPKRQRIFRWYNDDNENRDPDKYTDGDDCDNNLIGDEDDETWRKTRLEREKFLREKNIDNLDDIPKNQPTSVKAVQQIGKSVQSQPKIPQITIKSPDPKHQFRLISKRGSFLNRSEKVLNKLAQISSNTGLNENPIGSSKGKKSMVFAVISPPKMEEELKEETLKRKSDMLVTAPVKKLRFATDIRNKISFLDKLKDSDDF
ncbi:uncharacterized protein isoform X2 [Rhodnius prolixus]|uniref:uncharacterized protein isoform X2 n=1 Tax=Rhodnius prolixus TaxID=13249 RepID=UPI003D18EA48